jgi:hypothetical protein
MFAPAPLGVFLTIVTVDHHELIPELFKGHFTRQALYLTTCLIVPLILPYSVLLNAGDSCSERIGFGCHAFPFDWFPDKVAPQPGRFNRYSPSNPCHHRPFARPILLDSGSELG